MKRFLICGLLCFFILVPSVWADTTEDYFTTAKNYYQAGDMANAAKYFELESNANPANWQAMQALGYCRYKLNQLPESLAAYDKSLIVHEDPAAKAFADSLRPQVAQMSPTPSLDQAMTTASTSATSNNGSSSSLLADANAAKAQFDKSQKALQEYGLTHKLSIDETYMAKWGAGISDFHESHVDLETGLWYLDLGVNLDPTTNVGIDFLFIPLSEYVITYDSQGYEVAGNYEQSGHFLYLEPRIKFYSAPGGLDSYQGFGAAYMGYRQGYNASGDGGDFDIFALTYIFGFRTLPKDGWTMELGFQIGLGVLFAKDYNYNYAYYYNNYNATLQTDTIPFPFIVPEWRFGYTF